MWYQIFCFQSLWPLRVTLVARLVMPGILLSTFAAFVCVCVCVCVCVLCVYVCVCECIYFLSPKRLLLTEQNNNSNARVQEACQWDLSISCMSRLKQHSLGFKKQRCTVSNIIQECFTFVLSDLCYILVSLIEKQGVGQNIKTYDFFSKLGN